MLSTAFLILVAAQCLLRCFLGWRQMRHVRLWRDRVPAELAAEVSLAAHQKAADYTCARVRLGWAQSLVSSLVLCAWTLMGGLHALDQALLAALGPGMAQQLALLASFALISSLLDAPMALYQTFVLEQRFGFNQMTLRLWLGDALKSAALGVLLGLPIAALLLHLMAGGALWWLWAWCAWSGFQLLLMWMFPAWIAPLFNRFEPLKDEALAARLEALMQRCGFAARGLFVMDGSRRSAHANAFFTGVGSNRRVVLFDTLLKQLQPDEIEAVLAHELGHFHHQHVRKRMLGMFALSLAAFALLGQLAGWPGFYRALGVEPASAHPALALLLFLLATPVFGFFATPLFAWLSRRDERQADAWAVQHSSGAHLASALVRLSRDNAASLTPDAWYAGFYFSHPPTLQRLAHIRALPAPCLHAA